MAHPTRGREGKCINLTLGRGEVNHIPVRLEHVDLLNGLDGLHIELLERLLQLLVVAGRSSRGALHLSPGSSLATIYSQPAPSCLYFLHRGSKRWVLSHGGNGGDVHTL